MGWSESIITIDCPVQNRLNIATLGLSNFGYRRPRQSPTRRRYLNILNQSDSVYQLVLPVGLPVRLDDPGLDDIQLPVVIFRQF